MRSQKDQDRRGKALRVYTVTDKVVDVKAKLEQGL